MLFPGLVLMGLSTWQLTGATLTTPYPWLVMIYTLRGLGLGCLVQTLTVASFSKVESSQYTQASSLSTVVRFVFTSLGIAMLATFVQSRASTHISSLLSQSRPRSHAALTLLSQQGLNLAVQDAFWFSLVGFLVAFVAVCFLRTRMPAAREKAEHREQTPGRMPVE
jgi:hypothetical protein